MTRTSFRWRKERIKKTGQNAKRRSRNEQERQIVLWNEFIVTKRKAGTPYLQGFPLPFGPAKTIISGLFFSSCNIFDPSIRILQECPFIFRVIAGNRGSLNSLNLIINTNSFFKTFCQLIIGNAACGIQFVSARISGCLFLIRVL